MKNLLTNARQLLVRGLFFLREYFFPSDCALCGRTLSGMDECWYGLCGDCRSELEQETLWLQPTAVGAASTVVDVVASTENRCDLCGKALVSEQGRCLSCRDGQERAFDRMLVLFPYTGKYRDLLAAYKFGKNLALGHFFAEKIRLAVGRFRIASAGDSGEPITVVPVPPRPGKIKKVGWDQVEYLARLLENLPSEKNEQGSSKDTQGGILVTRCLKRLPSKIQKELTREDRLKNLQGRICLTKNAPETAVLIDDVITTGATLDVCASVLKAGGARQVFAVCLVYD